MTEPTKRDEEVYALLLSNRGRVTDLAAYREELLAASAQSAEPQEGSLERMLNHVSRLLHYDDGRPAYTQMIEAARLIDAERAALAQGGARDEAQGEGKR